LAIFCTSRENLVRFGLVTPEFQAKEVVRMESIIVTTLSSLWDGAVRHSGDQ